MVAEQEAKWGKPKPLPKSKNDYIWNVQYRGKGAEPPSLESAGAAVHAKKQDKQYTGTLIKGIAVMHKSCLQPIMNQDEAIASARMRRG